MNTAKCPKCCKTVTQLNLQELSGSLGQKAKRCVAFLCPECATILSVQIDPFSVSAEAQVFISEKIAASAKVTTAALAKLEKRISTS